MSQVNDALKHEVQLQRVATKLIKSGVYKSLDEAYKAVRLILLDAETITSPTKLNAVTKKISAAVDEAISKGWAEYTGELETIAIYDAAYYAGMMSSVAGAKLSVPAKKTITDYINKSLMSLSNGQSPKVGIWSEFVSENTSGVAEQINNLVKAGYVNNATVGQMTTSIRQFSDNLGKQQAEALARTGLRHYTESAREAMAQDNSDIIQSRIYVATFDNRTTVGCASLNKKEYKLSDDSYVRLPRHFNCLSGDTLVSTGSSVSSLYKRAYKGVMVNIRTKSGRSIKITPNHPVLTTRGWVAAKDVNLTDKVFCVENVNAISDDYKNSVKAKFSEIFSSLDVFSNSSFISNRPASTEDFHGDITDPNIEVVDVNSHAWDSFCESFRNRGKNNWFILRSFIKTSFHRLCSGNLGFMTPNASSRRLISLLHEIGNLLRTGLVHSGLLLLRSISCLNASFSKNSLDSCFWAVKADSLRYTANANSGFKSVNYLFRLFSSWNKLSSVKAAKASGNNLFMNKGSTKSGDIANFLTSHIGLGSELDDVVDVRLFDFEGHVYNLENMDNWYTSNGIVTHNCRSVYIFRLKGQPFPDIDRPAVGSGENYPEDSAKKPIYKGRRSNNGGKFNVEQIPASTPFGTWLKSQDRAFVDDVLGSTRAKLFLDGGLDIRRMSDAFGNELSLDALRKIESSAFSKAGI